MDNTKNKENLEKGVSIIICSYNGKLLLDETLKHLVAQNLKTPCEIILIDNASTDGTKEFADSWWKEHGRNTTITYNSFIEKKPGKSYAQMLGYSKAKYAYMLVCDDDNWLCKSYVQSAFDIMEKHPEIGALGGCGDAVFEGDCPTWFDHYSKYYAVGKQSAFTGDISGHTGYLYGAGMIIRKKHWLELLDFGFHNLLSCRKGNELSSGGDTEYCYALQLMGYKIWYDERLKFKHFMTRGRLNLKYLSKLRKAMGYSSFVILAYKDVLFQEVMTFASRRERLYVLIKKGFLKNTYRRVFGNYEQKEMSKAYFKRLYLLSFAFREYLDNVASIKHWVVRSNFNV